MLATKGRFLVGADTSRTVGLSRAAPDPCPGRLVTAARPGHVDLYQVHAYDALTPVEETMRALDQFVRAGKIRYFGLSNFTGWQLLKACTWPAP